MVGITAGTAAYAANARQVLASSTPVSARVPAHSYEKSPALPPEMLSALDGAGLTAAMVGMKVAQTQYKATIAMLKTAFEMQEEILELVA